MKPLAFFRGKDATRILRRAARCAAAPVSLHYVSEGSEGPAVAGHGGCAACHHVSKQEAGKAACRKSRAAASETAARQGRAIPFVCHMGFSCVSAPALPSTDPGFVLTFGPYCPSESAEHLWDPVREGWERIGGPSQGEPPFTLGDIQLAPPEAPPLIAEWTAESLEQAFGAAHGREIPTRGAGGDADLAGSLDEQGRHAIPEPDPYQARSIAAAFAAGRTGQARQLITAALEETVSGKRVLLAVQHARATALTASVTETAARAGMETEDVALNLEQLPAGLRTCETVREITNAVIRALHPLARPWPRSKRSGEPKLAFLRDLNDFVAARLAEGVTLAEAAGHVGLHPTAITHRLQRKFGLSFSQYVGRLRVGQAKELLRRTELPVREVAVRVGVDDPSNLGKLFRKFEGVSPSEYRKRHGRRP